MERRTFLKFAGALSGVPGFSTLGAATSDVAEIPNTVLESPSKVSTPAPFEPVRISVIGCGGYGVGLVSQLANRGVANLDDGYRISYFGIDSDFHATRYVDPSKIEPIWLMKGSCGGWPCVGRRFAKETPEWRFTQSEPYDGESNRKGTLNLADAHLVVVVAGLGGGFGAGFSQVIAHRARRSGALAIAMVTLPFSVDRQRVPASGELQRLERAADAVFAYQPDYAPWMGKEIGLHDRIGRREGDILQSVRNFIRTFAVPGQIAFDFQDIRSLAAGGGVSWYGHSVGFDHGGARPELAAEALINVVATRKGHPGYVDESVCSPIGQCIPNAARVLISFTGNANTLKHKVVREGISQANRMFSTTQTLINAHQDNTVKDGQIAADVWMTGITPV